MNSNNFHENDIGGKRTYSSIDGKNEGALLGEYNVVAGDIGIVYWYCYILFKDVEINIL